MRTKLLSLALAVVLVTLVGGCGSSSSKSTSPAPQPSSGLMTVTAAGIVGQNGNIYSVAVYDYDWSPGASGPAVGGVIGTISSNDFSFTAVLRVADSQGNPAAATEEKVFEPKTYSVVFFVSVPARPPQYFAEVRVSVNGDVTATAPRWANWTHP